MWPMTAMSPIEIFRGCVRKIWDARFVGIPTAKLSTDHSRNEPRAALMLTSQIWLIKVKIRVLVETWNG